MAGTTNTITAAQVLQSMNIQNSAAAPNNVAAATTLLQNSPLTGIGLSALGMLLQTESVTNVAASYGVQPPNGVAASGWTIGIQQLDLSGSPALASALMTQALVAVIQHFS
jgi:hypothetical protein